MQEVKPYVYEYVKQTYGNTNQILYSLDFRSPGKFDSNARKLGVMIILSHDIIWIDANEPAQDAVDIDDMVFFDNGSGAETFFKTIKSQGLVDSYVDCNFIAKEAETSPVIVSHKVRKKGAVAKVSP